MVFFFFKNSQILSPFYALESLTPYNSLNFGANGVPHTKDGYVLAKQNIGPQGLL